MRHMGEMGGWAKTNDLQIGMQSRVLFETRRLEGVGEDRGERHRALSGHRERGRKGGGGGGRGESEDVCDG